MTEWIVSSAVLIVVVALVRQLLKGKISLQLQYALWAIVLVRLLVPVSFGQTKISVQNVVQAEETVLTEQGEPVETPGITIDIPPSRVDYVAPDLSVVEPDPSLPEAERQEQYEQNVQQWQNELDADWEKYKAENTRHVTLGLTDILYIVWFAGMAVVTIVFAVSNLRFGRRLRRSRKPLGAVSRLPVYLTGVVETPCLFGLFRPAVYVTPEVAEDEVALGHVLAHEETHCRHGDHVWALLRCVCLVIHWYNPLVWLAAALSRRDAELACDAGAIRRIGEEERSAYGRTLIGLTCAHRGNLLHTATTMTGSKKSIKERIVLIAKKPKMAVYTLIAVILIAAIAVGCTFTGAEKIPLVSQLQKLEEESVDWIFLQLDSQSCTISGDRYGEVLEVLRGISEEQCLGEVEFPGINYALTVHAGWESWYFVTAVHEEYGPGTAGYYRGRDESDPEDEWIWIDSPELYEFIIDHCQTETVRPVKYGQGYHTLGQEVLDVTISIPKEKLPDSIYTDEGHIFAPNEIVVFETETTTVYLEQVSLHANGEDLYFCFNMSYKVPDSGSILLAYRIVEANYPSITTSDYDFARSSNLADDVTVYPDAVAMCGRGPRERFSFYVSPDAVKAAVGTIKIQACLNELSYMKGDPEPPPFVQVAAEVYIEQHRAAQEQEYIAVSVTHEVLSELKGLTELELGTAGLDYAVEMWQLDYDITVAINRGQEANTTAHTAYLVFLYDYMTEEYTRFLGSVDHETLLNVYNTPEMIDKYGDMHRAAAMELYSQYVEASKQLNTPVSPSDGLYNLTKRGDTVSLTLYTAGEGERRTFVLDYKSDAWKMTNRLIGVSWNLLDQAPEGDWDYWLTYTSEDGTASITFYAGKNGPVCYADEQRTVWWTERGGTPDAETLRKQVYDVCLAEQVGAGVPWEVPEEEPAPAYEEYFSQLVDYGYDWHANYDSDIELKVSSGSNLGGCELEYEEPYLYVSKHELYGGERLWMVTAMEDLKVMYCGPDWFYALVDGKTLIRMDYWGINYEVLFHDESGLIDQNREYSFKLADGKVMYFMAGTETGGAAIYRLYLPENRVDAVYEYTADEVKKLTFATYGHNGVLPVECQIYAVYPESNHEVTWAVYNPEFWELYAQLLEDPEAYEKYFEPFPGESISSVFRIARDYKIYPYTEHYYNTLTGENDTIERIGYSEGAPTRWWLE